MNTLLTIELLGGLRVRAKGGEVTRFRTQKTQYLLAFLACFPRRSHAREELIELFWPEADPISGRISLRTALSALRREIEPSDGSENSVLIADRNQVRLNFETVTTDLIAFETACLNASKAQTLEEKADWLERAAALYRGPLLPGCYEDWALRERERLEQAHLGVLRDLAAALGEQGELKRAIDCLHRVISGDPLLEEAYCDLIRFYLALNQPSAARRQYQTLARVLKEEMGSVPSPETRRLLDEIPPPAQPPSPLSSLPIPAAQGPVPSVAAPERVSEPARPHLPSTLNRFFGREEEIARLTELLRPGDPDTIRPRVITLTGPGGAGKSRLALEMARRLSGEFEGEAWFVSLADLTDARLLPDTLIAALRLERSAAFSPFEQIAARLQARPSLLVLDNLEQLLDDSNGNAEITLRSLQELLGAAPAVACLVTSRQRLDMAGEQDFPVLPLPVPEPADAREALMDYPAIQLFMDRAQAVRPGFQITPANAKAIAALCIRIEGVPLALELAAAWSATLTPAQILARLERGLELLSSTRADLPPRHRTLRAAVEWSYRMLSPKLQRFFAQLSVFRGGWSLEAVEAVTSVTPPVSGPGELSGEPGEMGDALSYLAQLQKRSLVQAEETGEAMRYRLLETLREYGDSQLPLEARTDLQTRHLRCYRDLALKAKWELDSPRQAEWMEHIQREFDNIRAALDWSCTAPERAWAGLELAQGLHRFWTSRGYCAEGCRVLADLLTLTARIPEEELTPHHKLTRANALRTAVELAFTLSDFASSRRFAEEALEIDRLLDYKRGIAFGLCYLGILADREEDLERAHDLFTESHAIWRALDNPGGMSHTLKCLGENALKRGEADRAEGLLQEGLKYAREMRNPRAILSLVGAMGKLHLARDDREQAAAVIKEQLELAREIKDTWHIAYALANLGRAAVMQQQAATALSLYEQSLALRRELGDHYGAATLLGDMGSLALSMGRIEAARAYYRENVQMHSALPDLQMPAEALEGCAELALQEGQAERAALLRGAIQALRTRQGQVSEVPVPSEGALAAAWERGQALPLEEVIRLALR